MILPDKIEGSNAKKLENVKWFVVGQICLGVTINIKEINTTPSLCRKKR